MGDPQIIIGGSGMEGLSNADIERTAQRLRKGKQYKDLSTVCVVPTRDKIPARVVESWMGLMNPMNNRFVRLFVRGMEVGAAYEAAVETVLMTPVLNDFKYMLTLEEDNLPPPDGLLKLLETICDCLRPCREHFTIVAGLYYTKGETGQPMIYGDPKKMLGFQPQVPKPDRVQECNGTGMGFTLFHMGLFRDKKLTRPWFKTLQQFDPQKGSEVGTQDLFFMGNVRRLGYRIASDNRVKVGHYDFEQDIVW